MDWREAVERIDRESAAALVRAAARVAEALLIEAERVSRTQTPAERDYETRGLSRGAPAGGWISPSELRQTTRALSEALAAERWVDGFAAAARLFARMGG